MAFKAKIVEVRIRVEASVSKYNRENKGEKAGWMKELIKGVKKAGNWSCKLDKAGEVVDAHPVVDGHPGHVQGKDWKMNVERGNNTVDRLWLSLRKYKVENDKNDPELKLVSVSASAFVETDTKR